MTEINRIVGIEQEPWIKIPNGKDLSKWKRSDLITYNQINRHVEKALFF